MFEFRMFSHSILLRENFQQPPLKRLPDIGRCFSDFDVSFPMIWTRLVQCGSIMVNSDSVTIMLIPDPLFQTASFIDFFRFEGLRCEPVHGQRRGRFIAVSGSELYHNTFDSKKVTSPKTNECPLKKDYFNRKYIFQPLIFRGHPLVLGRVP